ncbi:tripartite tricarboxylate transporter substrate-binding protein [Bradyrhizobium sp. USDA 4454]
MREFAPVALIASGPQLIIGRPDLPAQNLKELIGWLKANGDKATAGTAGPGSGAHVAGVFFQQLTNTNFSFVPYRGAGPALNDLMAGHIDIMFDQASNSLPQVKSGTVKAFAVTQSSRLASAPDIPTVDEAGLPGLTIAYWHGIWAPKGTPDEIVAVLVMTALEPVVRQRCRARAGDSTAGQAKPGGAARPSGRRDREMVADRQVGQHQAGPRRNRLT